VNHETRERIRNYTPSPMNDSAVKVRAWAVLRADNRRLRAKIASLEQMREKDYRRAKLEWDNTCRFWSVLYDLRERTHRLVLKLERIRHVVEQPP
jgi:hypothetical protein